MLGLGNFLVTNETMLGLENETAALQASVLLYIHRTLVLRETI